jgi:hypothetical protein
MAIPYQSEGVIASLRTEQAAGARSYGAPSGQPAHCRYQQAQFRAAIGENLTCADITRIRIDDEPRPNLPTTSTMESARYVEGRYAQTIPQETCRSRRSRFPRFPQ